jgi:hypothetical protein
MDRLSVYCELADCYDRLGQVSMRDRFLILAADAALEAGQAGEAERMRLRLLQGSRHHMLRPYNSFAEAARASDVQTYLHDLRTNYPLEVAQQLLESLKGDGETAGAPGLPGVSEGQVDSALVAEPGPVRAIPPTAPLVDLTGRQAGAPIGGSFPPDRPPGGAPQQPSPFGAIDTYSLREDPPSGPGRPMAQPVPLRAPGPRPVAASGRPAPGASQSARPTAGVPVTQPLLPRVGAAAPLGRKMEAPLPLAPFDAPQLPVQEREAPPEGGAWFVMLLVGVVGAAALALLAFTFARPFVPANWLP